MKDYCKYVNVFQGSGVIDLPKPEGIAATWYFRKAQCGNTTPAACLPFGKLSCGAYSGGYPTGYGTHNPNSCGSVTHFIEKKSVRGIAHMSQSGTGAIGFYYNYALTTPFYGELKDSSVLHEIEKESAAPGYYYVDIGGISAEATVTENTALHRYLFPKNGGRIAIDLSNDGLSEALGEGLSGVVENAEIKLISENEVLMSGFFRKIKLYFCIRVSGAKGSKLWDDYSETDSKSRSIEGARGKKYGAVFEIEGDRAEVRLALSTHSFEAAQAYLDAENVDFDTAKELAYKKWNEEQLNKLYKATGGKSPSVFEIESARMDYETALAEIEVKKAAIKEAETNLNSAKIDLKNSIIVSPVDGVVLTRSIDAGQTVAASFSTPELFTVAENLEKMKLVVKVSEADVGKVEEGQEVRFTVDAYPSRTFKSVVDRVNIGASATDDNIVSYETTIYIDNSEYLLRSGMSATADIVTNSAKDVMLVPVAAVYFDPSSFIVSEEKKATNGLLGPPRMMRRGQKTQEKRSTGNSGTLWILNNGTPEKIQVSLGVSDGQRIEVKGSAINTDMQIITGVKTSK